MSKVPVFPRVGEPWVECTICGFDFPKSQVHRDRFGRLVCGPDTDELSHQDHMEDLHIREEKGFGEPIESGEQ